MLHDDEREEPAGEPEGIDGRWFLWRVVARGADCRRGRLDQPEGNEDGLVMSVTVVKVVDPAKGASFFTPDKDNRFVAVQIKLENSGSATYDDSPSNGAVLLDTDQQSYDSDLSDVKACPSFASGEAKIAPGSSRVGCISFQVPKAAKVAGFQFTLDSGFGPETGEWTLG